MLHWYRSEHNYIFSFRIVHWVYNYMFRPCILAIVRLYHKLNKQLMFWPCILAIIRLNYKLNKQL